MVLLVLLMDGDHPWAQCLTVEPFVSATVSSRNRVGEPDVCAALERRSAPQFGCVESATVGHREVRNSLSLKIQPTVVDPPDFRCCGQVGLENPVHNMSVMAPLFPGDTRVVQEEE